MLSTQFVAANTAVEQILKDAIDANVIPNANAIRGNITQLLENNFKVTDTDNTHVFKNDSLKQ